MNGEIRIPVANGNIRRFDDPNTPGLFSYHALVPVLGLPELPLDVNPRAQNLSSQVARKIRGGLEEMPQFFHLLNRGITIIADHAESDNRHDELTLQFAAGSDFEDEDVNDAPQIQEAVQAADLVERDRDIDMDSYLRNRGYGIVDGGHTYSIIRDAAERAQKDPDLMAKLKFACVRLEVLVKVGELATDLARARNTSAQVKEQSLMNLSGKFEWLKDVLRNEPYADKIMWRENERDKPINATLIIQLLTALHPLYLSQERSPVIAYRGAGQCITQFRDEELAYDKAKAEGKRQLVGFRRLRPIVPDILRLYDHIRDTMAGHYVAFGGLQRVRLDSDPNTEVNGERDRKIRGRARAVISEFNVNDRKPHQLWFISKSNPVVPHQGLVMPILSGFRALIGINLRTQEAYWRTDPLKIYDENGQRYIRAVFEQSLGMGRAPNAVGKFGTLWNNLFDSVQMDLIRSTGALDRALEATAEV